VGVKTNPQTIRIVMLAVTPDYRRQKIGTKLINQFIKEIQNQNIKQIELEVRKDSTTAVKFYQNHQFKITDTIKKFYQNEEDAYIMKKIL